MSKKINYGNQLYSSSERVITLSASAGSFLKMDDVGSINPKGTTTPTLVKPTGVTTVSLLSNSTDMAGTIIWYKALGDAYTGTDLVDLVFEVPKATAPFVLINPAQGDNELFGTNNIYAVSSTTGFTIVRTNTANPLTAEECEAGFTYMVIG